jgi:hypothetical protein
VTRRPAKDATPLVLVVVGLVLFALLGDRRLSGAVVQHAAAFGFVVIAVALVGLALLTGRVVVTRRALPRRVRLVVLAPDSFAPSMDGVLRCAAQLSRVRRLVGGWFDRRASAVRVLLDSDGEGRMRYSLVVPGRSLPAVRSALGNYDRVQVRRADPEPAHDEGGCVVRAELRLARPSSEPLAHLALDPDPLQSFAGVLAGVNRGCGECAEVAVDLLTCATGGTPHKRP